MNEEEQQNYNEIKNNMLLYKPKELCVNCYIEAIKRIDKAIEYIEHSWWLKLDQVYDTSKDLKGWEVEQLLKILKGEENEERI